MGTPERDRAKSESLRPLSRDLLWVVGSLVAVAVLALTASYVPNVMKRLGVFYFVYGIACGMVMLWLAAELRPAFQRSFPYIGGVICCIGACYLGWLSYQRFVDARAEMVASNPHSAAIESAIESFSKDNPELQEWAAASKRGKSLRFVDYLHHRVSSIGDWASPFPELFWICEVLIASIACGWTMQTRRRLEIPHESSSP
ncbi:hypothetical protein SH668x_002789 [Planctomicrobium sp. SH668]|uniref:hypothetical protein n=1 Tax=Planctomicrobium sp. SH668 TaxID=3448126 RepID=UPI003F5C8637